MFFDDAILGAIGFLFRSIFIVAIDLIIVLAVIIYLIYQTRKEPNQKGIKTFLIHLQKESKTINEK